MHPVTSDALIRLDLKSTALPGHGGHHPAHPPGAELLPGSRDPRGILVGPPPVSPYRAHSPALCLARSVTAGAGRGRAAALAPARASGGGPAGGAGSARPRVVRRAERALGSVDHDCRAGAGRRRAGPTPAL